VIASLVPVLALGLVLADTYRQDANQRGLSEGQAEAALLAHTAVEPLLGGHNLRSGLQPAETAALKRMSSEAVSTGEIVRLRVRALSGKVVFSSDGTGLNDTADDEALDAAHGEVVADITRLDADNNPDGPQGIRVAEVYRPLSVNGHRVGVLEVYLPYTPIAHDVTAGLGTLYRDLGLGLAVLYLLLAAISLSATRRLRAQVARNAHLAEHDALTGLPNRELFHRRVVEALADAERGGPEIAVAVLDLDRFKEVNDTLGHGNGDALLVELARRLELAVGDDTVARLGGDEFGLILSDRGDPSALHSALHEIRQLVQQEIEIGGLPIAPEASIGYAVSPTDGDTADCLLQHADVAMYDAKSAHSGIARYESALDNYDSTKLALVAELRRAIAANELVMHYQPKAAISTGEIIAVEALVRWNHPDRGLLYPDAFLPIAEQTGIIDSLTRWVLATSLAQLNQWGSAIEVSVAVNISARDLSRPDFADGVLDAIAASGVAAERLLLEITETALFADPARAAGTLQQLVAAGVRISLDDFGCGQTSLSYLSTLPLHEVKIDKGFVLDMLADRSHAAIVRSVVDLAHNLGFEVVAEGVETEQILAALTDLGCDIAQGFLLARPMPAAELPGWLAAHQLPVVPAAASWPS
jgi:diguanylate cyclase (GGDEF)-like protein